jgi:hypothetical protein
MLTTRPLLIAKGVTGVCDLSGGLEQIQQWRSPSRVGRCKWLVVFCSRGCDPPVLGDQDSTGTSCAEI